jgi:hypothetical protein
MYQVLLERMPFHVSLDLDILRKTVSWEASLKFDHAKRRLAEGKAYKAQKVGHSLLALMLLGFC